MLDVRAPLEFLEACAPGAINIPLLDDQQRHLVGAEYKRVGQDAAIALGARLLDPAQREKRVERWGSIVERHPGAVIYCARGGMRSNISASWLSDAGVFAPIIKGGYKAIRQFLLQSLDNSLQHLPLVIVGGRTGIGKTQFLNSCARRLDLEGLANHRGSSFGRIPAAQPGNANFENAIAAEMLRLLDSGDDAVFVEDEARMIGSNSLPVVLHEAMRLAPIILLEETVENRIDNVIEDYVVNLLSLYQESLGEQAGRKAFEEHHANSLYRVRKRFGGENYSNAQALLETALAQHAEHNDISAYRPLVELLLVEYYDPMYDYQLSAKVDRVAIQGSHAELAQWCADMPEFIKEPA